MNQSLPFCVIKDLILSPPSWIEQDSLPGQLKEKNKEKV